MRQSYKPIVLPSVSIVLCIMLKVLLGYLSGFQSFKLLVQLSSWTMNAVVNTSLSQVLHFVGLSIHQSRPVCGQFYFFVVILIHQSRPMYRKFYFMQDLRYASRDQCVVCPTLCRAIDTFVKGISKRQNHIYDYSG